jgi:hypothetical protein
MGDSDGERWRVAGMRMEEPRRELEREGTEIVGALRSGGLMVMRPDMVGIWEWRRRWWCAANAWARIGKWAEMRQRFSPSPFTNGRDYQPGSDYDWTTTTGIHTNTSTGPVVSELCSNFMLGLSLSPCSSAHSKHPFVKIME